MGKSKKSQNQPSKSFKPGGFGGKNKKTNLQCSKKMFKVKNNKANKSKHKTKAVTSTLSRLINSKNLKQPSATETSNKVYSDIQDELHRSKVTDSGNQVSNEERKLPAKLIQREPVNMDEAAEQLASL